MHWKGFLMASGDDGLLGFEGFFGGLEGIKDEQAAGLECLSGYLHD